MKQKITDFKWQFTGLSAAGLLFMFWSTAEKIHLATNPGVSASCNLNPVVDCGGVLNHELSAVFGVSNSLIGIVAFTMLLTLGIVLIAGVKPNKTMKRITLVIAASMLIFSWWFFAASLFIIGKICLFCLGTWIAVMPLTMISTRQYRSVIRTRLKGTELLLDAIAHHPWRATILIYAVMLLTFLVRFNDYYFG